MDTRALSHMFFTEDFEAILAHLDDLANCEAPIALETVPTNRMVRYDAPADLLWNLPEIPPHYDLETLARRAKNVFLEWNPPDGTQLGNGGNDVVTTPPRASNHQPRVPLRTPMECGSESDGPSQLCWRLPTVQSSLMCAYQLPNVTQR